jgi:hypothetical protein
MHVPAARPMSERRLGDHRRTSGVIGQAVRQSGQPSSRDSASGHDLTSRRPTSCVDDGDDGEGEGEDDGQVEEECVME